MTRQPGVALLFVVGLLLGLALLAAGVLGTGMREQLVAHQWERQVRASLVAESAARAVVSQWSTGAVADLEVGSIRTLPIPLPMGPLVGGRHPHQLELALERTGTDLFLVRSVASTTGGRRGKVAARAGLLVRVVDPISVLAPFGDGIRAASVVHSGGAISEVVGCQADLPSAGFTEEIGASAIWAVPPDVLVESASALPQPMAIEEACTTGPSNWGSSSPGHACYLHLPLVHSTGPLRLETGEAHGIIAVRGDVHLTGTFRFRGLLLAQGRVTVDEEAEVSGGVAAEAIEVRGGAVVLDRCAAVFAAAAPAVDRAYRPSVGSWIPLF